MSKFQIFTIDGISLLIKLFYFMFYWKRPETNLFLFTVTNHSEVVIFAFDNLMLSLENFSISKQVLFYHNGLVLVLMPLVVICHNVWVSQRGTVRMIRAFAWISVFLLQISLPCISLSRIVHQSCISHL